MVYSTAELDARSALAVGLANAVVAQSDLESRSAALVETICRQPLDAVKAVKEYLREAPAIPASGRGAFAEALFAGVLSSR